MLITRRQFTVTTGSVIALAVVGCEESSNSHAAVTPAEASADPGKKKRNASKLAKEPFLIGPPGQYVKTGVYADYEHKGVWLVSDGQQLVALNSTCTHLGCATKLDRAKALIACPCHKSRFDFEGSPQSGAKAKRPLERCALRLVDGQVEVDPTRRFRKDKDQWDDPASALILG